MKIVDLPVLEVEKIEKQLGYWIARVDDNREWYDGV